MLKEILFWEFKLIKFNNKMISTCKIQMLHVYSDAIIQKLLVFLKEKIRKMFIHYRNLFYEEETGLSSTWWIKEAIRFSKVHQ